MFRALAAMLGAVALNVVPTVASSHTVDLGFAIEVARKSNAYRDNSRAWHGYARERRWYHNRGHAKARVRD